MLPCNPENDFIQILIEILDSPHPGNKTPLQLDEDVKVLPVPLPPALQVSCLFDKIILLYQMLIDEDICSFQLV